MEDQQPTAMLSTLCSLVSSIPLPGMSFTSWVSICGSLDCTVHTCLIFSRFHAGAQHWLVSVQPTLLQCGWMLRASLSSVAIGTFLTAAGCAAASDPSTANDQMLDLSSCMLLKTRQAVYIGD